MSALPKLLFHHHRENCSSGLPECQPALLSTLKFSRFPSDLDPFAPCSCSFCRFFPHTFHKLKLCGFITIKRLHHTALKDIYQYLFSMFFSLQVEDEWGRPGRYELSSPQSSSATSMSRPSRVPLTDGCKSSRRAVKMEMVPAVWDGARRT